MRNYCGDYLEPQTFNRYIYVGNNPVNWIDPSGYYGLPVFSGSSSKSGSYTSFLQAESKGKQASSTSNNNSDTYNDGGSSNQPLNTYDHAKDLDGNGAISPDEVVASEFGGQLCTEDDESFIKVPNSMTDDFEEQEKSFLKIVYDSIEVELGLGFGLGLALEALGINGGALVKGDVVNLKLDNGRWLFGTRVDAKVHGGASIWSLGAKHEQFMDFYGIYDDEDIEEPINESMNIDVNSGVSVEGYFIIGGTAAIGINAGELFNGIGDISFD